MNDWPKPNELAHGFGAHQIGSDGMPTARWEDSFLTTFNAPYPMRLSWEPGITVRKIRCHRVVAKSLSRCLEDILTHYGSIEAVREARMDLYGGCYMYRRARGGNSLSVHAWGAAIDLDPEENGLGKPWVKDKGMMPEAVIKIFKDQGWYWGGDFKRPDAMHFEAVNRS